MALRLTFLVAELVVAKNQYGDRFFLARKRKEMDLAAQIQWQLLPPLTFASEEVVVAAALEPAYDVGGDSFDYALDGDTLHVVLFDAMGHGVEAALIAALAVTAYRDGRRRGESLAQRLADVDAAVNAHFGPDRFTTAVAADLHVPSGRLTWMNAGHPRPLLLRRDRVVGALECEPGPPLGLKLGLGQTRTEQLEPGDHLLMFTDGMVEARSARGEAFGFTRLTDFFSREVQAGQPASETMRRLTHALLDYHGGRLQDDATVLMVGWRYSG
jgi:serine phosphatase RsbU (regulator of sigma subunit)